MILIMVGILTQLIPMTMIIHFNSIMTTRRIILVIMMAMDTMLVTLIQTIMTDTHMKQIAFSMTPTLMVTTMTLIQTIMVTLLMITIQYTMVTQQNKAILGTTVILITMTKLRKRIHITMVTLLTVPLTHITRVIPLKRVIHTMVTPIIQVIPLKRAINTTVTPIPLATRLKTITLGIHLKSRHTMHTILLSHHNTTISASPIIAILLSRHTTLDTHMMNMMMTAVRINSAMILITRTATDTTMSMGIITNLITDHNIILNPRLQSHFRIMLAILTMTKK